MLNFSIKELRATGSGKRDGVIEFKDGLNLIFGRSNTGKTWILKSINYLFGSSNTPIPTITGYTSIRGVFDTVRFGKITVERNIGASKATVIADSPDIPDGEYETDLRKTSAFYLNNLWLRILGVEEDVKVPKNDKYERATLSWPTIANVFFTDEDEIDGTDSILEKNPTQVTAVISSLYYLLTGDWKKGVGKIQSSKERSASKNAVTEYIDEQLGQYKAQRDQFASALDMLGSMNIDEKMDELSEEISFAQDETQRILEENSAIATRMFGLQQRKIDVQVLIDRYDALLSQYKADLQRLGFIYAGNKAVASISRNENCPFCGSHVEATNESNHEAIESEAKRIASEITMILETKSEVEREKCDLEKSISRLSNMSLEMQGMLEQRNRDIERLESDLGMFAEHASLSSRIEYIDETVRDLGKRKEEVNKKQPAPKKYSAKEEIEAFVGSGFTDLLNEILSECNFKSGYASWDFKKLDIEINGVPKSINAGKGYRSFLNSIVSFMLYEYFNSEDAAYKPGYMMIDTPLLGFDEDESLASSLHLKKGLYEYLLDHCGSGQVIIVDNLDSRPELDYEKSDAKVTIYKKDVADENTYGFLPDWRTDL